MGTVFVRDDEKYELDIPKENRVLHTISYDYSVEYIYELIKRNKIILEVPFQRNMIWSREKSSLLIESIIMNVPIPPLYFAEEENGDWLVIDGLQRLSSILNFYDNEFSLYKLEVMKELDTYKYKDLPPKSRSSLNDGLIRVNIIKKDSHPSIKYDIFMRLNRGAVTLNYQELRNCLYRGSLNDAVKELCSENLKYRKILREKTPHPRYLDAELIIRYFAISDAIARDDKGQVFLRDYRGKLVTYLNEYMEQHKNCSEDEKQVYKSRFNDTIEKVVQVFGTDTAFRDISSNNSKIYKTIVDFIMPSFERMSMECVTENKGLIIRLLKGFLEKQEIMDSLYVKTSDRDIMNLRIRRWFEELEGNGVLF